MQPTSFDSGFIVTWLRLIWAWLRESLFTPEHIVYTAMQMPAPVSYTHLDVYKRQDIWCPDRAVNLLAQRR